jgi:hypothetical protein
MYIEGTDFYTFKERRIPSKSYHYSPQGKRTVGRPKKRWREQQLWRRNGPNGPTLDVYDDDDICLMRYVMILS